MSNEKETQKSGRVATKYELKKQKKAEAKAKEARALAIWKTVGILFIIAVIALIAYFPIRNVYNAKKTVFTVGKYNISQVEYDYYYNAVKDNYLTNYASLLSYMGVSANSDFSTVKYSDNLTFADYFQKLAVQQIQQNCGLKDLIAAEGYTADVQQTYDEIMESFKTEATQAGVSLKDYIKAKFGSYATVKNTKPIMLDAYTIGQYLIKVNEEKTPSDEELEAYYQENKDTYDLVSYYMTTVTADLPEEPTELADAEPVYNEEGVYQPSQAEVDAAMAEAKANAEFIMTTLVNDENLHENDNIDTVAYTVKSWLFDSARKAGDEDIIESSANSYYLVRFVSRKRNDEKTVNARIIFTAEDNGAAIMAEYEAGGANLESFIAVHDKYSNGTEEGGYYENIELTNFEELDLKEWLESSDRKEGDVASFYEPDGYTYVVYFESVGDELWLARSRSDKLNEIMSDYLTSVQDGQTISDPDGFIVYIAAEAVPAITNDDISVNSAE